MFHVRSVISLCPRKYVEGEGRVVFFLMRQEGQSIITNNACSLLNNIISSLSKVMMVVVVVTDLFFLKVFPENYVKCVYMSWHLDTYVSRNLSITFIPSTLSFSILCYPSFILPSGYLTISPHAHWVSLYHCDGSLHFRGVHYVWFYLTEMLEDHKTLRNEVVWISWS